MRKGIVGCYVLHERGNCWLLCFVCEKELLVAMLYERGKGWLLCCVREGEGWLLFGKTDIGKGWLLCCITRGEGLVVKLCCITTWTKRCEGGKVGDAGSKQQARGCKG